MALQGMRERGRRSHAGVMWDGSRDRADKAKEEEKAMKLRRVEEDDQGLSLEDKERYIGMDCEMVSGRLRMEEDPVRSGGG